MMRDPMRGDLVEIGGGRFGLIRSVDPATGMIRVREGNGVVSDIPRGEFALVPLFPFMGSPTSFAEEMRSEERKLS
jgi:hypothetical protein